MSFRFSQQLVACAVHESIPYMVATIGGLPAANEVIRDGDEFCAMWTPRQGVCVRLNLNLETKAVIVMHNTTTRLMDVTHADYVLQVLTDALLHAAYD